MTLFSFFPQDQYKFCFKLLWDFMNSRDTAARRSSHISRDRRRNNRHSNGHYNHGYIDDATEASTYT